LLNDAAHVIINNQSLKWRYHSCGCYKGTIQAQVAGLNQPSGNDDWKSVCLSFCRNEVSDGAALDGRRQGIPGPCSWNQKRSLAKRWAVRCWNNTAKISLYLWNRAWHWKLKRDCVLAQWLTTFSQQTNQMTWIGHHIPDYCPESAINKQPASWSQQNKDVVKPKLFVHMCPCR